MQDESEPLEVLQECRRRPAELVSEGHVIRIGSHVIEVGTMPANIHVLVGDSDGGVGSCILWFSSVQVSRIVSISDILTFYLAGMNLCICKMAC